MKFYKLSSDDSFQDLVFDDDPEEQLAWEETYYSLLRNCFSKNIPPDFPGFLIVPNGDNKRKKKKADVYLLSACSVLVVSLKSRESADLAWKQYGQFVDLLKFPWGGYSAFHVTTVISNAVIWEKSKYREADYGRILYQPTLDVRAVNGAEIFMLEESVSDIYVSESFRSHYELMGLTGLDFSISIAAE